MTHSEIEQALRMARAYAAEKLPWFAPALYAARLVITDACPFPAGVDEGMRVYFNPKWIAQLWQEADEQRAIMELAWLWVHEICHRLREHGERAKERQAKQHPWNIAADLEINDAEWQGLARPSDALLPQRFRLPTGKLAEFYYDELVKPSREGKPFVEPSQGFGGSLTLPVRMKKSRQSFSLPRFGGSLTLPVPVWDEGSGVHGQKREWELPDGEPQAPSLTELEQEVMRRAVAEEIVRNKDRGVIPAGWLRWAEEVLQPKVDWREVLKRKVRGAITIGTGQRMDYSFARPHRRAEIYEPVLPPSLQGDFIPRVVCVVDTSGSISERELAQALAEVRQVLESLRVPIVVLPCDAVPYEPIKVFTASQLLRLHLRGGGGTDMVAGIEAALQLKPMPDVVIVLTDGYTPFPHQRYKVPIIFGILDPNGGSAVPKPPMPPWRESDIVIIPLTSRSAHEVGVNLGEAFDSTLDEDLGDEAFDSTLDEDFGEGLLFEF